MNDTPDISDPSSNRAEHPAESAAGSPAKPPLGTVFISHSSRNAEAAMQMVTALEAAGVLCWVAPRDIAAGSDYNDSIMAGINNCRALLLIYSRHSAESDPVKREVERALKPAGAGHPGATGSGQAVAGARIHDQLLSVGGRIPAAARSANGDHRRRGEAVGRSAARAGCWGSKGPAEIHPRLPHPRTAGRRRHVRRRHLSFRPDWRSLILHAEIGQLNTGFLSRMSLSCHWETLTLR